MSSDREKEYRKKYYQENKEKYNEKTKQWRQNNPDKVKEINRRWNAKNQEYYKKYQADRKGTLPRVSSPILHE